MNTNALAVMSRDLDQQVGLHSKLFDLGVSAILLLAYPQFVSNSKQQLGFISVLHIVKSKLLKCATNFRLYNQFGRLAKVYSGYK
jgi:hypothetical protein